MSIPDIGVTSCTQQFSQRPILNPETPSEHSSRFVCHQPYNSYYELLSLHGRSSYTVPNVKAPAFVPPSYVEPFEAQYNRSTQQPIYDYIHLDANSPQNMVSYYGELCQPSDIQAIMFNQLHFSGLSQNIWYYEVEFKRFRRNIFYGRPNYSIGDHVKVRANVLQLLS